MSTRKFSALFSQTAALTTLNRAAQRVSALQRLYADCTPPELVQASRVIGDHDGVLVIAADNGAIAAKLKQFLPRLLKNLQNRSAKVTGIRVRVQVSGGTSSPGRTIPKPLLPIEFIEDFERLADRVKDPGLRSALVRFAARRRGGA